MALEARIKQLLALDENKKCVDCGTRSPRWASYSLGVFVCLQCAAFHRALGTHISRVKSVDLDRWTEDQVRAMESMGNARGREEYGPSYAEVNNTTYLPDAHSLENFVRSKYVRRLYAKGGFGAAFNSPEAAAASTAAASTTARAAERKPAPQLALFEDDLWGEYREPEIDTTSKLHIDWPRKTTTAAAAPTFDKMPQKESSLIDLFEPAPVTIASQPQPQPQQQTSFFADFAAEAATRAAATSAAARAAAATPAADPFGLMQLPVAVASAAPAQPLQQPSFATFPPPLQQQQQQQQKTSQFSKPASTLSFDDDFGDFVAATAASAVAAAALAKQQQKPMTTSTMMNQTINSTSTLMVAQPQQQLLQKEKMYPSLLSGGHDGNSENMPPPLPAKDYNPFVTQAASRPPASTVDALAGLFGSATALTPTADGSASANALLSARDASPPPRMSTADILSLYGPRSGGAGMHHQQQSMAPAFAGPFGGPGASWA